MRTLQTVIFRLEFVVLSTQLELEVTALSAVKAEAMHLFGVFSHDWRDFASKDLELKLQVMPYWCMTMYMCSSQQIDARL